MLSTALLASVPLILLTHPCFRARQGRDHWVICVLSREGFGRIRFAKKNLVVERDEDFYACDSMALRTTECEMVGVSWMK